MQNSQLFRKGIVAPLTSEAEQRLRHNNADGDTLVKYFEINDELVLDRLFAKGLLKRINLNLKVNIDEYEEEVIEHKNLSRLKEILTQFANDSNLSIEEEKVILNIQSMCDQALKYGTSLFFIL